MWRKNKVFDQILLPMPPRPAPSISKPAQRPPPSPGEAPPSPAGPPHNPQPLSARGDLNASANMSVESKGKREKRVRSATRKRGARGQGGKQRKKMKLEEAKKSRGVALSAAAATACPVLPRQQHELAPAEATAQPGMPAQPVGMMPGPTHAGSPMTPLSPPLKRKRERKSRTWKPWSEQTWEERLRREKYQERRAAEREAEQVLPLSKSKRKKRRREIELPKAPRNTTQALIIQHMESVPGGGAESEGVFNDMNGASSMPSMQGLFSREALAHRQWRDERDSSDSENSDDLGQEHTSTKSSKAEEPGRTQLCTTRSRSPEALPGTPGEGPGGQNLDSSDVVDGKDARIRELEAHNRHLLARVAVLEAQAATRQSTAEAGVTAV